MKKDAWRDRGKRDEDEENRHSRAGAGGAKLSAYERRLRNERSKKGGVTANATPDMSRQ